MAALIFWFIKNREIGRIPVYQISNIQGWVERSATQRLLELQKLNNMFHMEHGSSYCFLQCRNDRLGRAKRNPTQTEMTSGKMVKLELNRFGIINPLDHSWNILPSHKRHTLKRICDIYGIPCSSGTNLATVQKSRTPFALSP